MTFIILTDLSIKKNINFKTFFKKHNCNAYTAYPKPAGNEYHIQNLHSGLPEYSTRHQRTVISYQILRSKFFIEAQLNWGLCRDSRYILKTSLTKCFP